MKSSKSDVCFSMSASHRIQENIPLKMFRFIKALTSKQFTNKYTKFGQNVSATQGFPLEIVQLTPWKLF